MLKLIIGRAGSGKTAAVIGAIRAAVEAGQDGNLLLVPEQYSHEAERELCRSCGDTLSLYAEVFSFTGLARRILSQMGGAAAPYLDKGGRMLCMALALEPLTSRLKVYGGSAKKAELQSLLLDAVDECKAAGVTGEQLLAASAAESGALGDKLADLALVLESFEAVVSAGHADPNDRLDILAAKLAGADALPFRRVYVDGFIDFTHQEQEVLAALLRRGVDVTVCLTLDDLHGNDEVFALSRVAASKLLRAAKDAAQEVETVTLAESGGKAASIVYFIDNLFRYTRAQYGAESSAIRLCSAASVTEECEQAAAEVLRLVREEHCRWRDIAIAVRGFDDYRRALESVFAHYGVPLYVAKKNDILSKSLPSMIAFVYDILEGGWEVDDVVGYLRTGLTGLEQDECDRLENYIFKWQLRAPAWLREGDWRQHPEGFGAEFTDETEQELETINALRRRVSEPLLRFRRSAELAASAKGQASALSTLLLDLKLPEQLLARSEALRAAGRETAAAEYSQLWEIIVSALEQSANILGDSEMDMAAYGRLFLTMLSKYEVGTIPVSLDRVSAGDFDRMRRRSIRHLLVLGASDDRLPAADEGGGIFSSEEREELLTQGIDLGGGGESELWREFSLIYNCLSLPSDSLRLSYSATGSDGSEQRPSFVINRAKALFSLPIRACDIADVRASAAAPALSLCAEPTSRGEAARVYFAAHEADKLQKLQQAAAIGRGKLSERAVEALYGRTLRLSASRIDKLAGCKYAYFCQYGLKAQPREPAAFRPPEIGSFIHAVLEQTAREVKARGGFAAVDDETLRAIVEQRIEAYIHTEMHDFAEKSERFIYLFNRLRADVWQIVHDMADELRRSDFEPLDFELDFSRATDLPPVMLGEDEAQLQLTGIVDRVDGWVQGDKLFLRVVDYKTGKKKFSLSDVWYGMGLQMLLYLFALSDEGQQHYGHEIIPAGVMYVPARSAMLAAPSDEDDASIAAKLLEESRRSGLVLEDPAVIEAWEHGESKCYIPIKLSRSKPSAESMASAEKMGLLYAHIRKTLTAMARELHAGSIVADPYFRSQAENACLNCDYFEACHFADGENGENCRYLPKLTADKVWGMMEVQQHG